MGNIDFGNKANSYERNALVQKSASQVLLNVLSIQDGEAILDLGCGPGSITRNIALLTRGDVVWYRYSGGYDKGSKTGKWRFAKCHLSG